MLQFQASSKSPTEWRPVERVEKRAPNSKWMQKKQLKTNKIETLKPQIISQYLFSPFV